MGSQFLIRTVSNWVLILFIAEDPGFEIVRGQNPRKTAEILLHRNMGIDPVIFLHR